MLVNRQEMMTSLLSCLIELEECFDCTDVEYQANHQELCAKVWREDEMRGGYHQEMSIVCKMDEEREIEKAELSKSMMLLLRNVIRHQMAI